MRIVSQNKEVDLNYFEVVIELDYPTKGDNSYIVRAYAVPSIKRVYYYILGRYETKERALQVMEEMRNQYKIFINEHENIPVYFYMPEE